MPTALHTNFYLNHDYPGPAPDTPQEPSPTSSASQRPLQPAMASSGVTSKAQKKKKANRACFHCQKAHLTCDDSRPCQRCVKRGIADKCIEGHRKKAKYLLDDEELAALKASEHQHKGKSRMGSTSSSSSPFPTNAIPGPSADPLDISLGFSPDPAFPFGSEAANLEYSILSAILGNSPSSSEQPPPPSAVTASSDPGLSPNTLYHPFANPAWPSQPQPSKASEPTQTQFPDPGPSSTPSFPPFTQPPTWNGTSTPSSVADPQPQPPQQYFRPPLSPPPSNSSPGTPYLGGVHPPAPPQPPQTQQMAHPPWGGWDEAATTVYKAVTRRYDYTQGYHFLMKYLHDKFDKNDILRVVRALAIVRPSLIALQMPLSEEDEVFVERCFQRSLIELDKLISFGGTPTVVWRRTGEICLVGLEFTMLTGWSREDLLGGKKFIFELFENQSTVEYYENLAAHAFENTTQAVCSHCVLLKPNGTPVPCAFCFSIRRDMFDLPSIIIGQWLPLL